MNRILPGRRALLAAAALSAPAIAFAQDHGCELELAAWLQARLDMAQPLAAPEAEEHARGFGADQKHGAVREIDQMRPFDPLFERSGGHRRLAQGLDRREAPAIELGEVLGRAIGFWRARLHRL